jgi:hypothetical protein
MDRWHLLINVNAVLASADAAHGSAAILITSTTEGAPVPLPPSLETAMRP